MLLVIFVLSVNVLGDHLRDVFNPRLRTPVSAAALLDVDGLTVALRRGQKEMIALDSASFMVESGEVLGLVGELGAGKSVTGAALVDLLVPPLRRTAGTITLAGQRLDTPSHEAMRHIRGRRIGFAFQDPLTSLNPVLTMAISLSIRW